MRYFHLNYNDAMRAMQEVWLRQDTLQMKRSAFHTSAEGMDASAWTESSEGEVLFRKVLNEHHTAYEEGDEQQVHTWLDAFGLKTK